MFWAVVPVDSFLLLLLCGCCTGRAAVDRLACPTPLNRFSATAFMKPGSAREGGPLSLSSTFCVFGSSAE